MVPTVAVAVDFNAVPFAGGALVLISAGYTTVTLAPAATLKPNRNVCPAAHVVKPTPSQAAPSDNSVAATVEIGRTHVCTPVTPIARTPSSAFIENINR